MGERTHQTEPAADEDRSRLDSLQADAKRLLDGALDAVEAERFVRRLQVEAAHQPSAELSRLISSLLSDAALGRDSERGDRLRPGLVEAQLQLGFPWALEVTPENLELSHQPKAGFRGRRIVLGALASVSLMTNALMGLLSLLLSSDRQMHLVPFFFAVGLAHSVAALYGATRLRSKRLYQWLGWAFLCGPAFVLLQQSAGPENAGLLAIAGLAYATPSMLTAVAAALIAAKQPPD